MSTPILAPTQTLTPILAQTPALASALASARPWEGLFFLGPGRWKPRMTQAVPPSSTWFPQARSPPR
jgi:hypothetical protein